MSVEAKRGCGYRKVGGLYFVSKGLGVPCDRLPYPLHICPTCGGGIKQSRGFQFIEGKLLLAPPLCKNSTPGCLFCPICTPAEKLGLMWVGEEHYATPLAWTMEAEKLGVSKRINAIPKGFEFGKTWVLVAHPKAIGKPCPNKKGHMKPDSECTTCDDSGSLYSPGVFHAFKPEAVELIVTPTMRRQKWVRQLQKANGDNLRLVEVPDGDKDHAPTVRQSARKRAMTKASRKAAAAAGEDE